MVSVLINCLINFVLLLFPTEPTTEKPANSLMTVIFMALQQYCTLWSPPQLLCGHTHWTNHTRWNSSRRVIGNTLRPLPDNTQQSQQTDMSPAGLECEFTAGERPHNLDHAATGIGQQQ